MSDDNHRVVALTTDITLEPNDPSRLAALCGPFDQNIKHLEKRLGVHIRNRGNSFQISGTEQRIRAAGAILSQLYRETLDRAGLQLVGTSMDDSLVEVVELKDHPWFIACQFHPEFTSTPRDGHPLFWFCQRSTCVCRTGRTTGR